MIAKEVAMPRAGGSFRGLVTYLTGSRGKAERVGRVQLTNCVSTDVASAVLEVENTQACNRRARHGTYHLILSFPAGEEPAADVLEAIERRACEALGFGEHQRVSVVHHDTDHLHVHVAINRVHPTTHRVHWPSYSKLVLDRLCVEFEQEYGLAPVRHRAREHAAQLEAANALRASLKGACAERLSQARTWAELHEAAAEHGVQVQLRGNGLALVTCDGLGVRASSVSRDLSKAALERRLGPFQASARLPGPVAEQKPEPAQPVDPLEASGQVSGPVEHEKPDASARLSDPVEENSKPLNRRAPDSERLGGIETLIGWIQRECAQSFRGARSWHELHEVAAAHGLRVKLRGNGLIFVTPEGIATKASSVARDLSKAALERRLGVFEAAATRPRAARLEYRARPMEQDERAGRLYDRYRKDREALFEARARATAQLRQQRSRQEERLTRISQRRWAAVRLVAKGRVAWALWSAYARQADRRERARVRNLLRAEIRTTAAQYPRTGWLEWLRSRAGHGDVEALATLRSRITRERQVVLRAVSSDAATRRVLGGRVDSVTAIGTVVYAVPGGSIRDDGKRLHLSSRGISDSAAETLLRLAHARYGARLGVEGDEAFCARIVRVAAAASLPITFADPKLEQRRVELFNQENRHGQRRAGETHRVGSTPAASRPRVGVGGSTGIRKSYAGRPRAAATPQAIADLRSLSSLRVVRFGRASEMLLPAHARRDLEQRRAEQPDHGVRRDSAERNVGSSLSGRARGQRR